jgi:hypothetical protein
LTARMGRGKEALVAAIFLRFGSKRFLDCGIRA